MKPFKFAMLVVMSMGGFTVVNAYDFVPGTCTIAHCTGGLDCQIAYSEQTFARYDSAQKSGVATPCFSRGNWQEALQLPGNPTVTFGRKNEPTPSRACPIAGRRQQTLVVREPN